MIPRRYTNLLAVLAVTCTLALAGCGSKASVSGEVTLDGQPIELGALTFQSSGMPKLSATIGEGGKYELEHAGKRWVEPGSYVVTVRGYERDTKSDPNRPPHHKVITPTIYSSVTTSGLSAEVKTGSNQFNFELKSTP